MRRIIFFHKNIISVFFSLSFNPGFTPPNFKCLENQKKETNSELNSHDQPHSNYGVKMELRILHLMS